MRAGKATVIKLLKRVLPRGVRNSLFHLGFHLAQPEFEEFSYRYALAPNMRLGLADIKSRGLAPARIVDVGAYLGDWSRIARATWPDAEIEMIEANREKQDALKAVAVELGSARVHVDLLGPRSGLELDFFVMESGSSVLEEYSPLERRVERLPVRTLDEVLERRPVDFIKIDTQGFELEVLKGGPVAIAGASAILLEVSLLQVNRSGPLLAEVVAFMADLDFVSYEVLELHRRPLDGAMNQIDILFVHRGSPLRADTRHF